MNHPPSEAEPSRGAVVVTVLVLAVWVALTLAAPALAPLVSDVAVQVDGAWRVAPPVVEETP